MAATPHRCRRRHHRKGHNSADVSAAFGEEATVNVLADDNGDGLQVTDVIDGNPLGFELFSSLDDTPLASQAFFGVFSITPTGDATYRFGSALTASIRGFTPDPVLGAGQSVLESATYTVTNANGLTDTALFSVRISRPAVTVIDGTNGPDVIQAGFRDTVINGLGGDDVLIGGLVLISGLGRDTLVGGDGDDRLLASPDDVLFAQNRANLDIFEGGSCIERLALFALEAVPAVVTGGDRAAGMVEHGGNVRLRHIERRHASRHRLAEVVRPDVCHARSDQHPGQTMVERRRPDRLGALFLAASAYWGREQISAVAGQYPSPLDQ